jgi:proline iminopeptidase
MLHAVRMILLLGLVTRASAQEESGLFPAPKNPRTGYLKVSELHRIFYECCGNPEGRPVMCLHGGPGVGSYPRLARYFDPEKYFIVLHDQRGAGRSEPAGELRENTTRHLVEDIEKLRRHLKLGRVLIYGGSWGTTLGLAYAETYPKHVSGLLLRGVFLGTEEERVFHYQHTGFFFPREHHALLSVLPDPSRGSDPAYLHELIHGRNRVLGDKVLQALGRFELKFMKLHMPDEIVENYLKSVPHDEHMQMAGIDLHYVTHRHFLDKRQLLRNAGALQGIPATLIHGRYDMATPLRSAYRLHRALPGSRLVVVEEAGHSESEKGITAAVLEAARSFEPALPTRDGKKEPADKKL